MYRELERAIGELRVNHTDKEITRVFCQHSSIVKRVSYEYTDNVTVAELRADHPELSFMDDDGIEEILEQAKMMRGTKEPDEDERLTMGDMKKLLIRNKDWGLAGSEQQHSWIQSAAQRGMTIEELAGMVWVCTEHGSIDHIEETMREYLKEKREKERGSTAQSTDGYDVEFAEECIRVHMGAFDAWPYGSVKKIEVDGDGNLRVTYADGMYWHYKEEDGGIIWW